MGRRALKLAVLIFYYLRLFLVFRLINRRKIVVLSYHGLLNSDEDSDYSDSIFLRLSEFSKQMKFLLKYYNPISLSTLVALIRNGTRVPNYSLVVTFDDGYRSNYTLAYPIMKTMKIPFTIFLTTDLIGTNNLLWTEKVRRTVMHRPGDFISFQLGQTVKKYPTRTFDEKKFAATKILENLKAMPVKIRNTELKNLAMKSKLLESETNKIPNHWRFLEWEQIVEMKKNNVEFGSHTLSHSILSSIHDQQDLFKEIRDSKACIEKHTDKPCTLFSYPNGRKGDFTDYHKFLLKKAGYNCAVTLLDGLNDCHTDLFAFRRLNISQRYDLPMFVANITGILPLARQIGFRLTTNFRIFKQRSPDRFANNP